MAPLLAGRYRLDGRLGAGGSGVVYRAFDTTRRNAPVAVKVLREGGGTAGGLLGELDLLRSLHHPGLARALDGGRTPEGRAYLVTERVEGVTLSRALRAASDPRIGRLVEAALDALAYLHGRGVLHRDLKPENILVPSGAPARVKLLDFGLSVRAARARGRAGTPGYAAPEVLSGRGALPASDLYALGVLLDRTLPRHPRGPAARKAREALLPRCLAPDPALRFRDAGEALDAWRWLLGRRKARGRAHAPRSGRLLGRSAELRAIRRTLRAGGALAFLSGAGLGKTRLLDEAAFLAARAGRRVARATGTDPAEVLLLDDADRLPARALRGSVRAARAVFLAGPPDLASRLPAGVRAIRLAPLDRGAVRSWTSEAFRASGLPRRLAAAGLEELLRVTGGVPAAVEAALERWLRAPGARPGPGAAPRGRLAAPERAALEHLQALGRPVPEAGALAVADIGGAGGDGAVARLETLGLLRREGDHLAPVRPARGARARPSVHARLASLLRSGRLAPERPAETAGHALLGGDPSAAAEVVETARRSPVDERFLDAARSMAEVPAGLRHEALLLLADRRLREGRPADVLELLRRGAGADPLRRAASERRRAEALQRLGRLDQARRVLARALRATGPRRARESRELWYSLGFLEHLAGFPERALQCAETGLASGQEGPEAGALRNLEGIARYRLGDLDGSARAHRGAIRVFRTLALREDEASGWTNLGNVWNARGASSRAAACHRRALRLYRRLGGRHRDEATALNNLGLSLRAQGRLVAAREAFREALALRETEGNPYGAASCHANLATVLLLESDHEAALHALDQALGVFGPGGHRREESIARRHRARALLELRRRSEALREALHARRLARSAALPVEEAEAAALVGELRARGGDLEQGLRILEDAASALERLGHPEGATAARLARAGLLLEEARAARAEGREGAAARLQARARTGLPSRGGPARVRRRVIELLREARRPALRGGPPGAAYHRLVALQERLATAEDPDRLLRLLVDAARELTGARRGFVILRAAGGRQHEVVRAEDAAPPGDPFTELSRSVVEQVMETGRTVVCESALDDPRFRSNRSVAALGLRSLLCLPIRVRGRTHGALYLDHPERPGLFRREDARWLKGFAGQAALVLWERLQGRRIEALNARLRRLLRRRTSELDRTRAALRTAAVSEADRFERMIGRSAAMREVWQLIERVAPGALPVLVQGETGTGKELVARALHARSPRRNGPFVSVNCGALPEALFESELFGHARGSFTGALEATPGLFRAAHGGTLLLDEVGELGPALQSKLLRALESGEVRPVGGTAPVRVDARVVAASNRELEKLVREGRFRADLFYRMNVVSIRLPPLRERPEDLPLLLQEFLARAPGGAAKKVSEGALRRLLGHSWPGNVRELRNEAFRLAAFPGSLVTEDQLSPSVRARGGPALRGAGALRRASLEAEREAIEAALLEAGGNRTRAAALLGVSRPGLYKKMVRCGLLERE